MIALATGAVTARTEGDRVVILVESGRDKIEVALSFNQTCKLANMMLQEAIVTLNASPKQADVIPFLRPKRARPK